jgi:hypothetical protein
MKKWLSPLIIIVLILGIGVYFSLRSDLLVNQFKGVITATLEKILGRGVSVGRIEGGFFGNIVLKDVEIGEQLTVEKVSINYNLRDALSRKIDIIESIERIIFHKPYALISGSPQGLFKTSSLHSLKVASQISAKIVIKEGELTLRSESRKITPLFKNISGLVNLGNLSQVRVNMNARSIGSRQDNFALSGRINLKKSLFDLDLMAEEADLAYYLNFLFPQEKLSLCEGKLNLNLRLANYPQFSLQGRGEIKRGIFKIEGSPLSFREVGGAFKIRDKTIFVEKINALWGGYCFGGKGKMDLSKGRLSLALEEKNLPYQFRINLNLREKPLKGDFILCNLSGERQLKGDLTLKEKTLILSTFINGNSFKGEVFLEEGHKISLPEFEIERKEGGIIKGRAILSNLEGSSADFVLRAKFEELRVEGEINCRGNLGKLAEGWGADLFIFNLLLNGREFTQISAELEYNKEELKIFSSHDNYGLKAKVNLRDKPTLEGKIDLRGIFPPLSLDINYGDKKWEVSSADKGYTLKAGLNMDKEPNFLKLELLFEDLDLVSFPNLTRRIPLFSCLKWISGGRLKGNLISQGPLDNLSASGNLEIISPGEAEKATLDFEFKENLITLNSLKIEGEERLSAKNLQIGVQAEGISVESKEKIKVDFPEFLEGGLFLRLFISPEKIEGKVSLANANFTYPSKSKSRRFLPLGKQASQIAYDYDIELEIGRNVRYYNRYVNLEVKKEGQLHFQGQGEEWEWRGKLESTRGRVIYLGTEFEVIDAHLEFKETRKGFLTGRAETYRDDTRITLKLEGELGNLKPELSSDSPLSEREIVSSLRWGQEYEGLTSKDMEEALSWGIGKLVGGGIYSALVDPLEKKLKRYLNLSLFKIETGIIERILKNSKEGGSSEVSLGINLLKDTRFILSKYITKDLYFTYEMNLKNEREKELGLEEEMGLEYTLKNGEVIKYKVKPGENGEKEQKLEIEKRIRF